MYPGPILPGQRSPVSIGNGLHWKHVDEFTLLQAACLWAEIEPLNSFQDLQCSPEATACYQMLARAIEAGNLEAHHSNPAPRTIKVAAVGQHAPDMIVARNDLEALANAIGESPLFLFPDTDAPSKVSSGRYSLAAVTKWYRERVASWPPSRKPPTREQDWEDAKREAFPGVTQAAVYGCRRNYAPESWTSKGRRRQTPPE
jgi:hypothetical protein